MNFFEAIEAIKSNPTKRMPYGTGAIYYDGKYFRWDKTNMVVDATLFYLNGEYVIEDRLLSNISFQEACEKLMQLGPKYMGECCGGECFNIVFTDFMKFEFVKNDGGATAKAILYKTMINSKWNIVPYAKRTR